MIFVKALGASCGALSLVTWLPQLRLSILTRKVDDISRYFLVWVLLGIECWIYYGLRIHSSSLTVSQGVNGVLLLMMVSLKYRADRRFRHTMIIFLAPPALALALVVWGPVVSVDIVGLVGAVLALTAWIPQVVRSWRLRRAADLSLFFLAIALVTNLGYMLYGFLVGATSLLWSQLTNIVIVSALIGFKLWVERTANPFEKNSIMLSRLEELANNKAVHRGRSSPG